MTDEEFALTMAKAHVAEFEERVEAQETLVAKLADAGQVRHAEKARRVLAGYRTILGLACTHLHRLAAAP